MAMILQKYKYLSEIDGRPITTHFYCFSPEERTHIQEILKKYKKPKVEAFVRSVELYMNFSQQILDDLNFKNRADHRDKLFAIKRRFEATYKDILQIRSGRFRILPPHQCDFVNYNCKDTGNPQEKIRREVSFNSTLIGEHLPEIIKNLTLAVEIEKVKRGGRRKADEFLLASQIAKSFKKYIGIPRPFAGPFGEIVQYCFGVIGIKGEDRTRAIRQAIKKLS
jgi:hypothetical protein